MKISSFKILSLLIALTFFAQAAVAEKYQDFTKVIRKDFSIRADGEVNIKNRKGSVEVVTWDKNSVDIEVTITVEARNADEADEVFENINIRFDNNDDAVSARTQLKTDNGKKPWWKWSSWSGKKKISYSIDYLVKMPKTCELNLEHSYGHVTVTDLLSDAVIELKYGDLKAGKIGGDLHLELGYGDARVSEASKVNAEIWYSDLKITSVEQMDIESRYSHIWVDYARDIDSESQYDKYSIGQIADIRSNGRYDDFEIERANNINVESHYSDYVLDQLSQSADMDMEYGEMIVKRLVAGFSRVKLEGRHVDFRIRPDKDASYMLNIEADYTHVEYPKQILRSDIDKEGSHLEFDGIIGRDSDPASEIQVTSVYGQLIIE